MALLCLYNYVEQNSKCVLNVKLLISQCLRIYLDLSFPPIFARGLLVRKSISQTERERREIAANTFEAVLGMAGAGVLARSEGEGELGLGRLLRLPSALALKGTAAAAAAVKTEAQSEKASPLVPAQTRLAA